jgi:hypothetical protein
MSKKKNIARPHATTAILGYEPEDCASLANTAIAFPGDTHVENLPLTDQGRENFLGILRQEIADQDGNVSEQFLLMFPEQAVGLIAQMEILLDVHGTFKDQYRTSVDEAKGQLLRNYAKWTN